jgi:crotonobetainyl-CoA:carnitine CoA-transferase CaiB-like acyl-CoA transferase
MPTTPPQGPLAGRRVADFSRLLPGPYCTRLLADLGADVIKVEAPAGDELKVMLPGLYGFLNRGKRVVRADLKSPSGQELAQAMLGWADVVIEGFRPGVAARLGIGYEDACRARPGVVYCSISGFGQHGPGRDRPGHDIVYEAMAGAFTGPMLVGNVPDRPHLPIGDLGAALFAALSVTAALGDRTRSESVRLDVSMQEAVVYQAITRWGGFPATRRPPQVGELGNFSPAHATYRTRDGRHLALAAIEDRFWLRLTEALQRPDLSGPPYDSHAGRMAHREHLEGVIAAEIERLDLNDALALFERHDVPAGPVLGPEGVAADLHLVERGAIVDSDDGLLVDFPVRTEDRRSWSGSRAPDPERDLQSVCRDLGIEFRANRGLDRTTERR